MKSRVTEVTLAALLLLCANGPAWAHTSLKASDPAPGEAVSEPLSSIRLEFDDALAPDGVHAIGLIAPDGASVVEADIQEQEAGILELAVPALFDTGQYTVRWRIQAVDGDHQDGAFAFSYEGPVSASAPTSPADSSPTPLASESGGASNGRWTVIVIAVALVGAGLTLAVTRMRRPEGHKTSRAADGA